MRIYNNVQCFVYFSFSDYFNMYFGFSPYSCYCHLKWITLFFQRVDNSPLVAIPLDFVTYDVILFLGNKIMMANLVQL